MGKSNDAEVKDRFQNSILMLRICSSLYVKKCFTLELLKATAGLYFFT